MNTFELASIKWSFNHVELSCTDENILLWFKTELNKMFPNFDGTQTRLISGEIFMVDIQKIKDSGGQRIAFGFIKELTSQGWEPFATSQNFPDISSGFCTLRLSKSR